MVSMTAGQSDLGADQNTEEEEEEPPPSANKGYVATREEEKG